MAGPIQRRTQRGLSTSPNLGPLERLRDEMEDLFDRFWGEGGREWPSRMLAPPMDISERETDFQVRMDLPGINPQELDIQVRGNQLTIAGERKEEKEDKGETFHRIERRAGRFSRSLTLPCPVDEEKIDAQYRDGILTISIPKCESEKARKIEVKAS